MKEYINGGMKLFNGDCMEVMSRYPDKYFDLAIIDPPYGIGEDGGKNDTRGKLANAKSYVKYSGEDKEPPSPEYFIELKRISKNQIIFGANHFIERIPKSNSSCWIVWDKENGNTDYADCELAYTSFDTAVRKFNFRWAGMLQGDMKNKEFRIHPNQKPVKLYSWILQKYCPKLKCNTCGSTNISEGYETKHGFLCNDCANEDMVLPKIVDTHLGSASNAIAWHYYDLQKGGEFVGIELSEHYFNESIKRIEQETAQLSMF